MRIKGGLGNQLFQYAAAYALSKRLDQPFQFDSAFTVNMTNRQLKFSELSVDVKRVTSDKELPKKIQLIKNIYINKLSRVLNISQYRCGEYLYWLETKDEWQPEFFTINSKNLYVDGYFQSEEYFKQYRKELIRQFTPSYSPELAYTQTFEMIKTCDSVAVHVRRSDFKKDKNPFHYLLDEGYYKRAIEYVRQKLEKPIFFWFSDDMNWVEEHIGIEKDFRYVNLKTVHGDIDDMMLMKNCNHIITANSTFSWWAAWLNDNPSRIRVVPQKPYGMEKMIPSGWVKL